MWVMGIDYSSHFVDCVSVPYEGNGAPIWTRFPLTGNDAFDRARSVADAMPGRASVMFDDVVAVGIEHPAGRHGVGPLLRIQGAVLSCIPPRMLVEPWPPGKWRKAVGLPGNASKDEVARHVLVEFGGWTAFHTWAQDAFDAYCIALATRNAVRREHREAAA